MKLIIHDLPSAAWQALENVQPDQANDPALQAIVQHIQNADQIVFADGAYAPCQGCFGCWTSHPAACFMKDKLQYISRTLGQADQLVILSRNVYGSYAPAIKTMLDRSIGISTPMACYRGKRMHHTLRYGKKDALEVFMYGDILPAEKDTLAMLVQNNGANYGFENTHLHTLALPASSVSHPGASA